jgi:hypothetical protein
LIDIEDKPKKFLNSRQWIGSMEVSFVLQNYLNVNTKNYISKKFFFAILFNK